MDAATVLGGKDLGVTQASVAQKVEGGSSAAQLREAVDARAFLGAGGGPIEVEARVEQLVRAVRERAAVCLAGTANELLQLERQLHEARASLASVPDGGEALHSALQSIDACRGSLSNEGRRFQRLIEALSAPAHDPASWADFGAPLHPDGRCNDSTRQRLGGSPTRGPKILHVKCNPASVAAAAHAKQVLPLAESLSARQTNSSAHQAELDELRQQILTLQTQNKRLASVFKGKIEEFRKAVQSLTGYRVDLHESGDRQYHLYLDSEANKSLRFRCNAQGDFELLESPLATEMLDVPKIRHLLESNQSIPAFVCAVLLEHTC